MIPLKAGFDKTPSSSSKRQGLHIPTGPLQPTQMRSPATDSTAVNTFKQSWSSVLIGPSILALRKALIGYSELQEAKLLQETLLVLETAQNCGLDRRQDGDQEFLDWLQALETLQEPADDDEDERNSNFGHRAIGRFPYRDRLQTRDSWGSVKNACRLLSALLRIWSMAKAKIAEALTESSTGAIIGGTDPLCHNHIAQAAQVIQQAWKLPIGGKGKGRAEADRVVANASPAKSNPTKTSAPKTASTTNVAPKANGKSTDKASASSAASKGQSSDKASTSPPASKGNLKSSTSASTADVGDDTTSPATPEIDKRLKEAKLTERRVKRWGQKKAAAVLDLANKVAPEKKLAPAMLWTCLPTGEIRLTATQALQAELGTSIEGDIVAEGNGDEDE